VSAADGPRGAARIGRGLLRRGGRAALATSLHGGPYVSLVLVAVDVDASPLLLLSDLAQHSRNIAVEPRVALLIEGAAAGPDPLSGPRLTVLGRAEAAAEPRLRARFVARHPSAEAYAAFADFKLWRVAVERGHLVAGFGRIGWLDAADLLFGGPGAAIAAAEPAIVARVNEMPDEILDRCVARQLGDSAAGWRATGCDPEGLDIRRGDNAARLDFAAPIATPDAVPAALARLLRTGDE
jgi:putative heme iron utilization protein